MNSRLHLCFLLAMAFALGSVVGTTCIRSDSKMSVEIRQVALDQDEEIDRLNQELYDLSFKHGREMAAMSEVNIRLSSLLPDLPTPCYFPDSQ